MTNLIDRMDQVSDALKAAGDDIAARTLSNARRDRIRGLVTPTAAESALGAAERHLAELVTVKPDPPSLLGVPLTVVPASQVAPHGIAIVQEGRPIAVDLPEPVRTPIPYWRRFEKRIEAKPYENGGYHSTGMTLADLRALVATLTQAGCPDDRFVAIRSTDSHPPELIIDAGKWKIEP